MRQRRLRGWVCIALVALGCEPGREGDAARSSRHALQFGSAVEVDVPVRTAGPFNDQNPKVASDGVDFLVIWDSALTHVPGAVPSVVTARLSASGTVLDPDVGVLAAGVEPAVAFGGGEFLAAWVGRLADAGYSITAQHLAPDGQPLGAGPFQLRESSTRLYSPAVGWNGQTFVVAWSVNTDDIHATRVPPGGGALPPTPMIVSSGATFSDYSPRLACRPGECLLIWERLGTSWPRVTGTTIDADGGFPAPRDLVPLISEMFGQDVSVSGGEYLVAYTRGDTFGNYTSYAERFTRGLSSLNPGGVITIPRGNDPRYPSLVADGARTVVVSTGWDAGMELVAASIDLDAGVTGLTEVSAPGVRFDQRASIALADGGPLVVWTAGVFTRGWLWATHLNPGLQRDWVVSQLNTAENSQDGPAIVPTAGGFLALFRDLRAGPAFYVSTLDGLGRPLGPARLGTPTSSTSSGPSAAASPDAGWVAWLETSGTTCTPLAAPLPLDGSSFADAGRVVGGSFPCSAFPPPPRLVQDGQTAVVSWRNVNVLATRLAADGAPLDLPVALTSGGGIRDFTLASDGAQHLLVWNVGNGELFVRRFTPALAGAGVATSITPLDGGYEPAVLGRPGGPFVVAWVRATPQGYVVLGTQVDATGVALDPGGRVLTQGKAHRPALFSNPEDGGYLLAVVDDGIQPATTSLIELGGDLTPGATVSTFTGRQPVLAGGVLLSTDQRGPTLRPVTRVMSRSLLGEAGSGLDGGVPDAGLDAGSADAGAVDAGEADAGAVDAGEADAGAVDAGFADAGAVDAGEADAGAVDAGEADAGAVDAGEADAGAVDAGESDAGMLPPMPPRQYVVGCACASAPGSVWWFTLAALALRSVRRAPRRPSPASSSGRASPTPPQQHHQHRRD